MTPNEIKSNITLLMYSYDRHEYLARAFHYWGQTEFNLLIADDSLTAFPNAQIPKNIKYFHMRGVSQYERIRALSKKVKTAYVLLVTDDDFFFPSGIIESLNFLISNNQYSAAQGQFIRFDPQTPSLEWYWDYKYACSYEMTEENFQDRLQSAYKPPLFHYCYAVMKKNALDTGLDLLKDVTNQASSTYELSFLISIMIHGKYKTLPTAFAAREKQEKRWTAIYFNEWMSANESLGFEKWNDNFINSIMQNSNHTYREAWSLTNDLNTQLSDIATLKLRKLRKLRKLKRDSFALKKTSLITSARKLYRYFRMLEFKYKNFGINFAKIKQFNDEWNAIKKILFLF